MTCPHCSQSARFVGYRCKRIVSLVGEINIQRGYYHCKSCSQGQVPWDEMLSLSPQRLTPAAQEVTSLAGVQESFGKAAKRTLRKLAGLRLSESSVERTTEAAGARLGGLLKGGKTFGASEPWQWNKDSTGKTCAYVSLDATGILMQGPNGVKVDGRMINVGMVYNPQPRQAADEALSKPCDGVRYLAGFYTLAELGTALRRQAGQVGMNRAEQWIALSDGGNGLEEFFDVHFPRAVKILDFQHAAGHLAKLTKLWRPGPAGAKLLSAWCHILKHAGGAQMIKVLERLKIKEMNEETRAEHERVLNYIRGNQERMKYSEYLKQGWQIASGAVESACKTLINQRLCMGGMRWGEEGSDGVAHLRALYRSDTDQWDGFWSTAA
ncbi:MAG: ISKra4 family transposase [Pseudomonadota bacterium]|nr:ISKra4 family transposase [Pseudomonadota bacterium]